MHPVYVPQNSKNSIVSSDGRYDFDVLSPEELDVIQQVLKNSQRSCYVYHSLGLLNEAYSIVYKPRYILLEIIIQKYSKSNHPVDALAVAEAYRLKGTMFREAALKYYEFYLKHSPIWTKRKVCGIYTDANEPFLSYHIAELYQSVSRLDDALKFAKRAERNNANHFPAYPALIGSILLKQDSSLAVDYLQQVLQSKHYLSYRAKFQQQLEQAIHAQQTGYKYHPRAYKPSEKALSLEMAIQRQARNFVGYIP